MSDHLRSFWIGGEVSQVVAAELVDLLEIFLDDSSPVEIAETAMGFFNEILCSTDPKDQLLVLELLSYASGYKAISTRLSDFFYSHHRRQAFVASVLKNISLFPSEEVVEMLLYSSGLY